MSTKSSQRRQQYRLTICKLVGFIKSKQQSDDETSRLVYLSGQDKRVYDHGMTLSSHRWHSVKVSQQSLSRLVDHPYLWRFTPEWWYHNGWFYEFTMLLMMNIWLSCQMLIVIIEMLLFLLWGLWRWENPGEARGRNLQLFCKLQMQLLGNFLQPSHDGDAILST